MILNKSLAEKVVTAHLFQLSLVFASLLLIYWPSTQSLWALWVLSGSPTYSHGLILFVLGMYVFFTRMNEYKIPLRANLVAASSLKPFIALLLLSFIWVVFVLTGIKVAHQFIFIFIFPVSIWFLFGGVGLKHLSAPLLLSIFAIPVWEIINQGHLQVYTAYIVSKLLNFTGVSSFQEGTVLLIENGKFTVADNCSGMRQLVTAIPIAVIFAAMFRLRLLWAAGLVAIAIVVASFTNIIRIYIVVVSGYLTDMEHYFVKHDHVTLGWALFAVMFSLFLYLSKKYYIPRAKTTAGFDVSDAADVNVNISKIYVNLLIVILVASAGPLFYAYRNMDVSVKSIDFNPPSTISGWKATEQKQLNKLAPNVQHGDVYHEVVYAKDLSRVYLNFNYFLSQSQDKEAISKSNFVYDKHEWSVISAEKISVKMTAEQSIPVVEIIIKHKKNSDKLIVWRWYLVGDKESNSYFGAKLLNVWGFIVGEPEAGLIIVAMEFGVNNDKARALLHDFVTSVYVTLKDILFNTKMDNK